MRLFHNQKTGTLLRLILACSLALVGLSIATSAAHAGSVTIYKNSMKSSSARKEIKQMSPKANCKRGGTKAFRFEIGKRTKECAYRVPVVGRDVGVTVTARLFKSTPRKVRPNAYLSVSVRQDKDGSRYQLCVFPNGRRFQLRKVFPSGKIQYLDKGKAGRKVGGFGKANRMTLRAFNHNRGSRAGSAGVVASVNGSRLAAVNDSRGNVLEGRDTTFSIGSKKSARGARGSFANISGLLPNPF